MVSPLRTVEDQGGKPVSELPVFARAAGADGAALGVGVGVTTTLTFTPTAAAYDAGDVMGASVEASWIFCETGLAVPANSLIRVLTSILKIDETALISGEGAYTLQNYGATQPSAQADLATWTLASADLSQYRGSISLGTPLDLGAAAYVRTVLADPYDIRVNSAGAMWSRLVTVGAFTATAIARQVQLHGFLL